MSTKKITDFTEKTSVEESDLFLAGNQGTSSLRKLTFSNILNGIKNKFTSWTFNGLNTTDKTLVGAVNEVNDNISNNHIFKTYRNTEHLGINSYVFADVLTAMDNWTIIEMEANPFVSANGLRVAYGLIRFTKVDEWRMTIEFIASDNSYYLWTGNKNYLNNIELKKDPSTTKSVTYWVESGKALNITVKKNNDRTMIGVFSSAGAVLYQPIYYPDLDSKTSLTNLSTLRKPISLTAEDGETALSIYGIPTGNPKEYCLKLNIHSSLSRGVTVTFYDTYTEITGVSVANS